MEEQQIFKVLQPKKQQFLSEDTPGYRPKSQLFNRTTKKINISNEDELVRYRPPSQQSNNSKASSKRIVLVARNGKKQEPLDEIQLKGSNFKTQKSASKPSLIMNRVKSQNFVTSEFTNNKNQHVNFNSPERVDHQPEIEEVAQRQMNCNDDEIDPFLLDSISLSDPIWTQIIPEGLLNTVNLERLIEDNPEYFHHQLGLCACYRCKCGRCKCDLGNQLKLKINGNLVTIYSKDFTQKKISDYNLLPLNQSNYQTQFLDQKTIDFMSSHQSSYNRKQFMPMDRYKQIYTQTSGQMGDLTSYKSTFQNWGAGDHTIFKRPIHLSTSSEIPFIGKSVYQDTFSHGQPKADTYTRFKNNLQVVNLVNFFYRSPLPTGPFMGQTTNSCAFVPFKIAQQKFQDNESKRYNKIPIYEGQFTSTAAKDFRGEKEEICPANYFNKMWKKKLIAKYNQIRNQRLEKQLSEL